MMAATQAIPVLLGAPGVTVRTARQYRKRTAVSIFRTYKREVSNTETRGR
ncbi:hypothetical protein GCM10008940_24310 [Microbulbifer agarilyticus]